MFPSFRSPRRAAAGLYTCAVEAARAPVFYRDFAVPDSIEGRYEMIVLHVVLLLRRLGGGKQRRLAQAVVDIMAADLDRSIRELGVGDMSVGKFMKRLGEGLYGRAEAYNQALDARDIAALETALLRNIYDGYDPGAPALAAVAAYVGNQQDHLAGQAVEDMAAGTVQFQPFADS